MTPPLHLNRLFGLLLLSLTVLSSTHAQAKEKKSPPVMACEPGKDDKECTQEATGKTASNTSAAYQASTEDKPEKPAHKRKKKAKKKGTKKTKGHQSDGF